MYRRYCYAAAAAAAGPLETGHRQPQPPLLGAAAADFLGPPSLQSGGPRTTPSGYPGGPVVPGPAAAAGNNSGHLSPKMGRRLIGPNQTMSSPYSGGGGSDHVIRTTAPSSSASPQQQQQGPMTFTRALEVTDSLQQQQQQIMRGGGRMGQQQQPPPPPPGDGGGEGNGGGRDSVYDMNYEISV